MNCALLLFLAFFIAISFYLLFQNLLVASVRIVADVIAMVRPVDEREVDDLLNEKLEETLRANLTSLWFREGQRVRARLLFEYLQRMAFNALVLLFWAQTERERLERPGVLIDENRVRTIGEITGAGAAFRLYAIFALARLAGQILLSELKIRSVRGIAKLRHVNEINGLDEYRRLIDAAVALSATEGREAHRRLRALLRGSDSSRRS